MLIDRFKCYCPNCNSEQLYSHMLSEGKYSLPEQMKNICTECGYSLRKENVQDWKDIEAAYRGPKGPCGEGDVGKASFTDRKA